MTIRTEKYKLEKYADHIARRYAEEIIGDSNIKIIKPSASDELEYLLFDFIMRNVKELT